MSRRPSDFDSPDQARRNASAADVRARLLDIDVGSPKRIDEYLDYFGSGEESGMSPSRAQPPPPAQTKD